MRLTLRSFIFGPGEGLLKSNRRSQLERDCESYETSAPENAYIRGLASRLSILV